MIPVPFGSRVWLDTGHTDPRRASTVWPPWCSTLGHWSAPLGHRAPYGAPWRHYPVAHANSRQSTPQQGRELALPHRRMERAEVTRSRRDIGPRSEYRCIRQEPARSRLDQQVRSAAGILVAVAGSWSTNCQPALSPAAPSRPPPLSRSSSYGNDGTPRREQRALAADRVGFYTAEGEALLRALGPVRPYRRGGSCRQTACTSAPAKPG
jgi:hypothetical protein